MGCDRGSREPCGKAGCRIERFVERGEIPCRLGLGAVWQECAAVSAEDFVC